MIKELGPARRQAGDRIELPTLQVAEGRDNVWAMGGGRLAAVPDGSTAARRPPNAQHAIREGRVVGSSRVLAGRTPGRSATGRSACSSTWWRKRRGRDARAFACAASVAWFAARTHHLYMMPGMARRVRLGVDWAVGVVFGRASAELGQLGHPPSLGTYLDEAPQPGEVLGPRPGEA